MGRTIKFFGTLERISETDTVQRIDSIVRSPKTEVIEMDEGLFPRFARLTDRAGSEMGLYWVTYEEDIISGSESLQKFKTICLEALGDDKEIDPYLQAISEMTHRVIQRETSLYIET